MAEKKTQHDDKKVKDNPQEQGEIPRKRDDSEDDRKGPYRDK